MRQKSRYRIAIVAGEVSGDLLAAGLIRELKSYPAEFEFTGIAGKYMQQLGCESLYDIEKLTVMGLDGLPGRVSEILGIRRQLAKTLSANPPDLFIGVDAPDFNLALEKRLRRAGIPVLHYVSPTVWAWRKYRLRAMRYAIDKILVLFPFELDFYRQHNLDAVLVGHPMVKDIAKLPGVDVLRARHGLSTEKKIIALLPGSRKSEIHHMAGDFLKAAARLAQRYPDLQFVTAMPDARLMAAYQNALSTSGVAKEIDLVCVTGHSREIMAASDILMLASGTAALEAAIIGRPVVVAYKVSWLTKTMVQLLSRVKYFSMPNNLAGYRLVPELMQDDCTAENLDREIGYFIDNPDKADEVKNAFKAIRRSLDLDSDVLAAATAAEMLGVAADHD